MKDKFKKWWDKQPLENQYIFATTALVTVCGFLFYKAGYKQCEQNIIRGILKYEGYIK